MKEYVYSSSKSYTVHLQSESVVMARGRVPKPKKPFDASDYIPASRRVARKENQEPPEEEQEEEAGPLKEAKKPSR